MVNNVKNFTLIPADEQEQKPVESGSEDLAGFTLLDGNAQIGQTKLSLDKALDKNPEQYREINDLAKEYRLPVETVERNYEKYKKKKKIDSIDLANISKNDPVLFKVLQDRRRAVLLQNDVPIMERIENTVKEFKEFTGAAKTNFKVGQHHVRTGRLGTNEALSVLGIGAPLDDEARQEWEQLRNSDLSPVEGDNFGSDTLLVASEQLPILMNITGAGLKGFGVGFGTGGLTGLGVGAVTGPGAGVTALGTGLAVGGAVGKVETARAAFDLETGLAYAEFLDIEGISKEDAARAAVAVGAINAGLEFVSFQALVGTFSPIRHTIINRVKRALGTETGREIINGIATRYVAAVGAEGFTEFLQELTNISGGETLKMFTDDDYSDDTVPNLIDNILTPENVQRMTEAGIKGTQASLIFASPGTVASGYVQRKQNQRMQHANEQEKIDNIAGAVQESNIRETAPDEIRTFLQEALDEHAGDDTVFIPASDIAELDLSEFEGEVFDVINEQLKEAVKDGADIVIPLSKFASDVMTNEQAYEILRPHIRLSSGTLTQYEAETFDVKNSEKVQQLVQEAASNVEMKQEADAIVEQVVTQLVATGRIPEQQAKIQSKVISAYVTTQAQRKGKSVNQIWNEMNLRVVGPNEEVTGEQQILDQSAYEDSQFSFEQVRDEFLNTLPEDAGVEDVMENLDQFTPELRNVITALDRDDWLGFDYPSQAINAVFNAEERPNFELSQGLKAAIGKLVNTPTRQFNQNERDLGYGQDRRTVDTSRKPKEFSGTVTGEPAAEGWVTATRIRRSGIAVAVYRGSRNPLVSNRFDQENLGKSTGHPSSGLGVWFTTNETEASRYGSPFAYYLDIRNPIVIPVETLPGFDSIEAAHKLREKYRKQGYDGLIIKQSHLGGNNHIVAFHAEQVIPVEQDQSQTFYQNAVLNNLGMYSALTEAVRTLPLPQWKVDKKTRKENKAAMDNLQQEKESIDAELESVGGIVNANPDLTNRYYKNAEAIETLQAKINSLTEGKPAAGDQILALIKKQQGIKAEEIQWTGIEEYLTSDPTKKFTKQEVVNYLEANGVNITVNEASEEIFEREGGEEITEMEWDDGEVWDDPEAWQHYTEDLMYEFRNGEEHALETFGLENWITKNIDTLKENIEGSISDELKPQLEEALDFKDLEAVYDEAGYDLYEDAIKAAEDDAVEFFDQRAMEDYYENPQYIFYSEPTDLYIFGSDDLGYIISSGNYGNLGEVIPNRGNDIYSLNEAQIQAENYAREQGLLGDEEDSNIYRPRWEDYTEGDFENYTEEKLILPDISPSFTYDAHFPDENIVAFIRRTDRDLQVDFEPSMTLTEVAKEEGERKEKVKANIKLKREELTEIQNNILEAIDTKLDTSNINEDDKVTIRSKLENPDKWEEAVRVLFTEDASVNVTEEGEQVLDWITDYHRVAPQLEYLTDFGETREMAELRIKAGPETHNSYHIDELQSDWHQQGRQYGYALGDKYQAYLDKKNAEEKTFQMQGETVNNLIEGLYGQDIKQAYLNHYTPNDVNLAMTALFVTSEWLASHGKEITVEDLIDRVGYAEGYTVGQKDIAEHLIKSPVFAEFFFNEYRPAVLEFSELDRIHKREQEGPPDAPFKGDAWLTLAVKRAILQAVDNDYDAITWANSETLGSRWSSNYDEMYTNQYDKKMPSIVKKLLKVQPVEISWEGENVTEVKNQVREFAAKEQELEDAMKEVRTTMRSWLPDNNDRRTTPIKDLERGDRAMDAVYSLMKATIAANFELSDEKISNLVNEKFIEIFKREEIREESSFIKQIVKHPDFIKVFLDLRKSVTEMSDLREAKQNVDDSGLAGYWAVPLTKELKQEIKNNRFSLFQADKAPRGQITFNDNETIIKLFQASNLSTFLHEAGHLFLQMEMNSSKDGSVTTDQKQILDWLGVSSFSQITRQHHEKFARGFEAFLMEGKAPSLELQSAFRRFKNWLLELYKSLAGLQEEAQQEIVLSDEIRGVMGRLLATDEQIAEVEALNEYAPLFTDAARMGMTDAEYEEYKQGLEKARAKPRETLAKKLLRSIKKAREKWYQDETKKYVVRFKEELEQQPVYAAQKFMREKDVDTPLGNKLNSAIVKEMYDGTIPRELYSVVKKDADLHPDEIAESFGFKDGKTMLDEIIKAPKITESAEVQANAVMQKLHGDILNEQEMQEEAQAAAHDEERGKLILTELRILARNNKERKSSIDRDIIKAQAKQVISSIAIGDIRPDVYRRAEVRAATNAVTAMNSGDTEAAFSYKRQQVIQFYLYKEAREAKLQAEKIRARQQKAKNKSYNANKFHPDYIHHMKLLLQAYDFRKTNQKDREIAAATLTKVNQWIENQINHAENPAPIMQHSILNEIKHWKEMTLAELQGLDDVSRSIYYVGRQMSNLEYANRQAENEHLAAVLLENWKNRPKKADKGTKRRKMQDLWSQYSSTIFLLADQTLRRLDNYKPNGDWYRAIKKPIDDAVANVLIPSREKSKSDMEKIYNAHYTPSVRRSMNKPTEVPGTGKTMTRWEVISLALNWGSESSRKAILEGVKEGEQEWTEGTVKAALDTLSKNDWDFVQAVWDYNETYRDSLFALEKRRKGVAPAQVEPMPVQTKYGVYRGGYYRLFYDAGASVQVSQEQAEEMVKGVMLSKAASARTKDGMLQERVGSGKRPVDLNIGNWHKSIEETLLVLALTEPVAHVQKIIASKPIKTAIEATQNQDALMSLDMWLKDAAIGEIVSGDLISRLMRKGRTNLTASYIGWKLSTIIIQPTGIFQSAPVVGYSNLIQGTLKFLSSPLTRDGTMAQVQRMSNVMAERAQVFNKDMQDTFNQLHGSPWMPSVLPKSAVNSLFAGIVWLQRFVDTAVFLAAYQQAKQKLGADASEDEIIYFAERQVVRTQSTNVWSDRTPIERGTLSKNIRQAEWVRMWTVLGSYMFTKGNLMHEVLSKKKLGQQGYFKTTVDMMMLFAAEAIIINLISEMFEDDDRDENDDPLALEILKDMGLVFFSTLPIVREFGSELAGFESGPTITKLIKIFADATIQTGQVVKAAAEGDVTEELDVQLVKALTKLAGGIWGIPASQINNVTSGVAESLEGEDVPIIDYLIYREK